MQEATQLIFEFAPQVKEFVWEWKRWDVRADGKVFWQYRKKQDSSLVECWVSWDTATRCQECSRRKSAKFRSQNPEKHKASHREWREKNKEKHCQNAKNYYRANRKKANETKRKRRLERRKADPLFALKTSVRSAVTKAFKNKGYSKTSQAGTILGCDWNQLKHHIESQFTNGMNWDNRHKWHIDHIIPLASAQSKEDVERLNHYSNLRPLWSIDNLKKGAKTTE